MENKNEKPKDNPELLKYEALKGLPVYKLEVKAGMTFTGFISDYFKNIANVKDKAVLNKEVSLALFYLGKQKEASGTPLSVNKIKIGWQIEIIDGQLFITDKNGKTIIDGADLKKPPKITDKEAVTKRNELQEEMEKLEELPEFIYKYKRSKYVPEDTSNLDPAAAFIIEKNKESDAKRAFKIVIHSTADNVTFRLDNTGRRVNLNRGSTWQADFTRAFTEMKAISSLPQLTSMDVATKGISAVHDLSLPDQQIVMNHALAYLRGEKLREDLKATLNIKNATFEVQTEWRTDPDTRIASVIDLQYSKPEIIKPPEPVKRPPEDEDGRKPPRPPEPVDPEKLPIKPDEIPALIEALENNKYRVSKKGILKGGLFGKTKDMTSSTITESDGTITTTWFVIDKQNPENPPHYLAINSSNPFRVAIGPMEYDNGLLNLSAKPGKIAKVIDLDKTSRQATKQSLNKILQAI